MRILVIGATGYIGSAVAARLRDDGHKIVGLVRTEVAVQRLRSMEMDAIVGDLQQRGSLNGAIVAAAPDAVIVLASVGGSAGDAAAFSGDRDAMRNLIAALGGSDSTVIFTSGSAVFGIFSGGENAAPAFAEDTRLPLPSAIVAPSALGVTEAYVTDLAVAIQARLDAERVVLDAPNLRTMVIRPGNVYGFGGSVDIPKAIAIARAHGFAPHWGRGLALQGYVHLDDVVDLYRLALARGRRGGIYHAVAEEVSQRDLSLAISRMIGAGDRAESVTLDRIFGIGGTRGVRLSLSKRLSAEGTRAELNWKPVRNGVLAEVEFGSYAQDRS